MPVSSGPCGAPTLAGPHSACFVCGQNNSGGLRIRYRRAADGSIEAWWTPSPAWEGFPGIIHGGIISTILDEAMSKAVTAAGHRALTAELKVRFRHAASPGRELVIRGRVLEKLKRRIRTEAVVHDAEGQELAHAWATFLVVTGTQPAMDIRRTVCHETESPMSQPGVSRGELLADLPGKG